LAEFGADVAGWGGCVEALGARIAGIAGIVVGEVAANMAEVAESEPDGGAYK
jgi:hypothetical protein